MDPTKERFEKAVKGLDEAIHHLTWLGRYWGLRGVLVLEAVRTFYRTKYLGINVADTLSARSSTYYAAAGNAKARAEGRFFTKPLWLALGALCLLRAFSLSKRLEKLRGRKGMTPDELDVRSSILRKMGRRKVALLCIEEALSCGNVSTNTRALLLLGQAEVLQSLGHDKESAAAYREAWELREQIEPSTHVRLLRSLADWHKKEGTAAQAAKLLHEARDIAGRYGLEDQIVKIQIEIEKIQSLG